MNEYLIQKETLTGLADEIRVLSGTTTAMGLNDMTTNIADANTEVDAQTDLIAQVAAALEGKASGGSGGGAVETVDVTNSSGNVIFFHQYSMPTADNYTSSLMLSINKTASTVKGSYVVFSSTSGGFPIACRPSDAAELIPSFSIGEFVCYRVNADCNFYVDD